MLNKNLVLFLILPACVNIVFISLYFSGNHLAQQIAAPSIQSLPFRSWREFGLIELTQNAILLFIVFVFFANCLREKVIEKALFMLGAVIMLFLLLEEIDYGIHYYEYYIGHTIDIADKSRNWHNKNIAGKTNVAYLKKIVDFITVLWFVLIPLVARKISIGWIHKLIPSPWFLVGFTVSLLFANLAHYLDDLGWAVIDGVNGNLTGNISEFRETTSYYLYLLYALQLAKTSDIFNSRLA